MAKKVRNIEFRGFCPRCKRWVHGFAFLPLGAPRYAIAGRNGSYHMVHGSIEQTGRLVAKNRPRKECQNR